MIYQPLRLYYGWLISYNSAKDTDGINVNITRIIQYPPQKKVKFTLQEVVKAQIDVQVKLCFFFNLGIRWWGMKR